MTTHPAVDLVTDKVAVVMQSRPVVPLTSWMADAIATCADSDRAFQLLTPPESRITLPMRTALSGGGARWVVRDPGGGCYDGFSGLPLEWDDSAFSVAPGDHRRTGPSRAFLASEPDPGSQLVIDLRVGHRPATELVLGGAVETLAETLAGTRPAGWGTCEPAMFAWQRSELTELCRRRSPGATWLMFVGPGAGEGGTPFIGTQQVNRVKSGVKETITFVCGHRPEEKPPLDALLELAETFARQGILVSLTAQRTAGRTDLTYAPRWCGPPIPVGMAVGAQGVEEMGRNHALTAPLAGRLIGPDDAPSVWYRLGDGTDPDGWKDFNALMRHLRPEGSQPMGTAVTSE